MGASHRVAFCLNMLGSFRDIEKRMLDCGRLNLAQVSYLLKRLNRTIPAKPVNESGLLGHKKTARFRYDRPNGGFLYRER